MGDLVTLVKRQQQEISETRNSLATVVTLVQHMSKGPGSAGHEMSVHVAALAEQVAQLKAQQQQQQQSQQ
jgi:hypothetical protein